MRIELLESGAAKLSKVLVTHAGQEIVWDVNVYNRTSFLDLPGLFKEINGYWATLPMPHQRQFFDHYVLLMEAMTSVADQTRLNRRLRDIVKDFYNLLDLDSFSQWIRLYGNLKIPTSMRSEYETRDIKSWTYLRDEYEELMVYAIYLRPMIPVFGEYIERIQKAVGPKDIDRFTMALISTSKLYELPAMRRFREYVNARVEYVTIAASAVMNGLGSSELPKWLLAKSLVRRVVIGEVSVLDDKSSIISDVHHFIDQALKSMDRNFKGKINEKPAPADAGDEDNMSMVETFKVKQEQSDGNLVMLSFYTEQIEDMAVKIDPTIDPVKLQQCVHYTTQLTGLCATTHHMTLAQWVLKQAISPRAIPALTKAALLRSLAVTQALLWHWGFLDLAALVTATPYQTTDYDSLPSGGSKGRLNKEQVDALIARNPYFRRENSKTQNERQANVAYRAIELISAELVRHEWVLAAPPALQAAVLPPNAANRMLAPAELKSQLCALLLRLS